MELEEQVISYYFLGLALFVFVLSQCEFICNSLGMVKAILSKKDIKGTELEKAPLWLGLFTPLLFLIAAQSKLPLIKRLLAIQLLSDACYVILYIKAIDNQGVFHWMAAKLYGFFEWIEGKIYWAEKKESFLKHGWIIFSAILIAIVVGAYYKAPREFISLLGIAGFLLLWWLLIMDYRNSCSKLLMIEIFGGVLFAAAVVSDSKQYFQEFNVFFQYIIFVGIYTVFVIFTTLFTNDAPAKLALNIINTSTTLITFLFNIGLLCLNMLSEMEEYDILINASLVNGIGLLGNIVLLPFLSAGYIALLFKEMQIYWRNNRRNESV